jgi:hypothetical protein
MWDENRKLLGAIKIFRYFNDNDVDEIARNLVDIEFNVFNANATIKNTTFSMISLFAHSSYFTFIINSRAYHSLSLSYISLCFIVKQTHSGDME